MDQDNLFALTNMIILGELFFFTQEGIRKEKNMIDELLGNMYQNMSFN